MEKGKKYMLFLEKGSPEYIIKGVYEGKFSIDKLNEKEKLLEKNELYNKNLKEINERFKKEIQESLK